MSNNNTTSLRSFLHARSRGLVLGLTAGVVLSVSFATWASHPAINQDTLYQFQPAETIEAAPFNTMFEELYTWADGVDAELDAVSDLQAQIAVLEKAVLASPCGETGVQDGSFGGYAGGKALCVAVDECGNSQTAHMCRSGEVVRHLEAGGDLDLFADYVWISTGMSSDHSGLGYANDCAGWNSPSPTQIGVQWDSFGVEPRPSLAVCSTALPILCCD